jgi:hypothetical protein
MQFREVVLVETGEVGAVFGEDEFWDYVIVEGSLDGANWLALVDGYDSNAQPEWKQAYNLGESGSSDLYKNRKIELEDNFAIGDTILLRFRLNADAFVEGWGWAIDDLQVGDVTSSLYDDIGTDVLSISPNPVHEQLNISSKQELEIFKVRVFNLSGKLIKTSVNRNIDVSGFENGTYFIQIFTEGLNETHKFIKI